MKHTYLKFIALFLCTVLAIPALALPTGARRFAFMGSILMPKHLLEAHLPEEMELVPFAELADQHPVAFSVGWDWGIGTQMGPIRAAKYWPMGVFTYSIMNVRVKGHPEVFNFPVAIVLGSKRAAKAAMKNHVPSAELDFTIRPGHVVGKNTNGKIMIEAKSVWPDSEDKEAFKQNKKSLQELNRPYIIRTGEGQFKCYKVDFRYDSILQKAKIVAPSQVSLMLSKELFGELAGNFTSGDLSRSRFGAYAIQTDWLLHPQNCF